MTVRCGTTSREAWTARTSATSRSAPCSAAPSKPTFDSPGASYPIQATVAVVVPGAARRASSVTRMALPVNAAIEERTSAPCPGTRKATWSAVSTSPTARAARPS